MGKMFPDYKNNLVNFYSSLSKHFGVKCEYSSIKTIDKLIKKTASTNIVILMYNGLSSTILEKYNCDFLLGKKITDITVNYSGINKSSTFISNGTLLNSSYNSMLKLIDIINCSDKEYKAYGIFPYNNGLYENEDEAYTRIKNLCEDNHKKLILVYFDNIGKLIRNNGVDSKKVKKAISVSIKNIEKLKSSITDSSIFVTADYGYIDSKSIRLNDFPNIMRYIDSYSFITDRLISVNLKTKNIAYFKRIARSLFGDDIIILSNYEINSKRLVDDSKLAGDIFLICVGNRSFGLNNYGGFSKDEVLVPIIYFYVNKDYETIRKANKDDYEFVYNGMLDIQLRREKSRKDLFYKKVPITKDEFFNLCNTTSTNKCFIYEKDGKDIGFIIVELRDFRNNKDIKGKTNLVVSNVYVKKVYRRNGVGTKLFLKALEYSESLHMDNVYAFSWCFDAEFMGFLKTLNSNIVCNLIEVTRDNVK